MNDLKYISLLMLPLHVFAHAVTVKSVLNGELEGFVMLPIFIFISVWYYCLVWGDVDE